MALPLVLAALALPCAQGPDGAPAAPFILVSGCRAADGSIPLTALDLGDGGTRTPHAASVVRPAEVFTPGGIRIRARAEGIKLDFVGGAEAMLTPSLRLCLRDGEQTLPPLGRLALAFADGSRLELEPHSDPQRPLRRATFVSGDLRALLWPSGPGAAIEASYRRARAPADPLLVLGDGRAVYRAVPIGPLLALRAVLRPRDDARFPATRFVLAGDVLAESLRRLPSHVPPHPVQFPQAPEAARRLAELAGVLFTPGRIERTARAKGPLVLALPDEWRLDVAEGPGPGTFVLALLRADATIPAVEWTISPHRTELHLVRPNGGEGGGPRWFLRGLDLSEQVAALWPWTATPDDRRWAAQELRRLGARNAHERMRGGAAPR